MDVTKKSKKSKKSNKGDKKNKNKYVDPDGIHTLTFAFIASLSPLWETERLFPYSLYPVIVIFSSVKRQADEGEIAASGGNTPRLEKRPKKVSAKGENPNPILAEAKTSEEGHGAVEDLEDDFGGEDNDGAQDDGVAAEPESFQVETVASTDERDFTKGDPSTAFSTLDGTVSDKSLKAIAECGFTHMMEIQFRSIPILLEGHDLLGAAKTGRWVVLHRGNATWQTFVVLQDQRDLNPILLDWYNRVVCKVSQLYALFLCILQWKNPGVHYPIHRASTQAQVHAEKWHWCGGNLTHPWVVTANFWCCYGFDEVPSPNVRTSDWRRQP